MPIDLKKLPAPVTNVAAQTRAGVADKVAVVKDAGTDVLKRAKDAAATGRSAFEAGKSAARSALAPFDMHQQIGALQPGDTYKLGSSAEVSVETIAGQGSRATTVTRTATGFVVAGSGEAGAGLTTGSVGGGDGKGESSVFVGGGGRAEYTFATAAEAERGARVLQQAQVAPPSADDLQFLQSHLSALEVKGTVAADLAVKLGGASIEGIGLGAGAGVRGDTTVRVEVTNGQPSALVLRQSSTAKISANAATDGMLPASFNGSADVSASIEQRMPLPSGLSLSKVLSDPGGALKATGHTMMDSEKISVTLGISGSAGQSQLTPGVVQDGVQSQVKFDANLRDVQAAVGRFRKTFDYDTSLAFVGNATNVSASLSTSHTWGISARASGGVGIDSGVEAGVKADLEATRTHSDTVWRYPAPGAPPASLNDTVAKLKAIPAAPPPFVRP